MCSGSATCSGEGCTRPAHGGWARREGASRGQAGSRKGTGTEQGPGSGVSLLQEAEEWGADDSIGQ